MRLIDNIQFICIFGEKIPTLNHPVKKDDFLFEIEEVVVFDDISDLNILV